ncbi:MAG: type II secretion system protein GspC [Oligoflexia bacterium]|nr:type II secretion system protein GspC [Oligoflexia bacterium]
MKWLKRFLNKQNEPQVLGSQKLQSTEVTSILPIKPNRFRQLPFKKYMPHAAIGILALMAADLTSVNLRSLMLPKGTTTSKKSIGPVTQYKPRSNYDDILARNIFNSDGLIPDVMVAGQSSSDPGVARESALPLVLMGTIVHANPGKCVATVQVSGNAEKVLPYIPNDEIEGMATLMKVERKKAFIRNLQSGAYEYIQIKDEVVFAFTKKTVAVSQDGPIMKESDTNFAITRSDLDMQMNNLPELLTQARAVPNIAPGSGGKVDGFRIVDIQDNSIFRKLGINPGDVIKGVDGEALDSPAKAMELYNGLKNKSNLKLSIERNGKTETFNYNIR